MAWASSGSIEARACPARSSSIAHLSSSGCVAAQHATSQIMLQRNL
jgi:hypothetical protein